MGPLTLQLYANARLRGHAVDGPLCRTKGRIFSPYHFPPWGWNGSSDLWGILRMTWAERGNFFQWPGRCTEIGLLTKCKGVCLRLTNSISHPIPGGHFNNAAWQGTLAKQNAISELLFFWKEEIYVFFFLHCCLAISGMRWERVKWFYMHFVWDQCSY